jgi:hypothetical protein
MKFVYSIDKLYYYYYPHSKLYNLGFQNFTMRELKYFMSVNNCTMSENKEMFDNIKLFSNLLLCTLNLYSI